MPTDNSAVLLTNFLPPYRVPVLRELLFRIPRLQILLSTPMETGRDWPVEWQSLPVQLQNSFQWRKTWRHRNNFTEQSTIHFPYDTVLRLRAMKPGIIISGELGARTLQSALYRLFARTPRLVIWATVSEVTELDRGRLRKFLRCLLFRIADAIIVNGSSGMRYVCSFEVPAEKVFRVPQTTELQPFLDLPLARSAPSSTRLLYSGRLVELKGLALLLQGLSAWADSHPNRNIELTLAGDGPLRDHLLSMRRPSNFAIHLLGHVAPENLPQVYGNADLLVFPSLADEWGLAVVEALAAGLPVLGSLYSQAVEDLVRDGENGWTFRPDHAEEFALGIDRCLSLPPHSFEAMRLSARNSVAHMTPTRMAQDMEAAVNYALAPGSQRA